MEGEDRSLKKSSSSYIMLLEYAANSDSTRSMDFKANNCMTTDSFLFTPSRLLRTIANVGCLIARRWGLHSPV